MAITASGDSPFFPLRSIVFSRFGSKVGYAIAPLERLFFDVLTELGGGDPSNVHFAYPSLAQGAPTSLPPESALNVTQLDFRDCSARERDRISDYVRRHAIRFALFVDARPTSPLYRELRRAGVLRLLAYWGAPISSPKPWWKLWIKRTLLRLSPSKLDALIFESKAMARLALSGRGVPPAMIHLVPLGVDTQLFTPAKAQPPHGRFGFPADRKIVFYAGHLEHRKGVHVLIEAAIELLHRRQRRDVCFLICGNRPGEEEPLRRMYQGLGLDQLIVFGGYRNDLPEVIPGCFCGVIPSVGWDSFPRTSLEMAASGLPIVASRLDGIPESVIHGQTGLLFQPGNAAELAECLTRLLDAPLFAAELGRRGRRRCEEQFSLAIQRRRLASVIRECIGDHDPVPDDLSVPLADADAAPARLSAVTTAAADALQQWKHSRSNWSRRRG